MRPDWADPVSLAAAAARLRSARPSDDEARTRVLTATGRLLGNLAAELVENRSAVPPYVSRTAASLARAVLTDGAPDRGGCEVEGRRREIPFTGSIRLGRMG